MDSSMVVRKVKTISSISGGDSNSTYKVVRRPEVVQKVIQLSPSEMEAIQSQSESRLSAGSSVKRVVLRPGSVHKRVTPEREFFPPADFRKRRRSEGKGGKGLRHFSMKVCEKVREKGATTYNEVADELVAEFTGSSFQPNQDQNYDQKNIRRRVYDALNVLMAMNIISKEKKEIRWIGLPSGFPKFAKSTNTSGMEREKRDILARIARKKKDLQALILQQIGIKNLIERNKAIESVKGPPPPTSTIHLPILVVSTNKNTTINCSVAHDKKEYNFQFDDVFEIKDESHVMQSMGMVMGLHTGTATHEDLLRAKSIIPRSLVPYLEDMIEVDVGETSGIAMSSFTSPGKDYEYLEDESGEETASENEVEGH